MLLDKYLPRIDFDSYEDFKANYRVNIPDDFNFGNLTEKLQSADEQLFMQNRNL